MHKTFHRVAWSGALMCCLTASVGAQEVEPARPAERRPPVRPEAVAPTPLTPPQPDTTLLDDTDASGLRPRLRDASRAPDARRRRMDALPIGQQCVVTTVQGNHRYLGTLETVGDWVAVRLDGGGGMVWIPSHQAIIFKQDTSGDARKEDHDHETAPRNDEAPAEDEAHDAGRRGLRDFASQLERALAETQAALRQSRAEAEQSRREAQSQKDLAEQMRVRAEEIRRMAERELEKLRRQLEQAIESAPK